MKCINCHKEIVSGMKFCPYCNTKQPESAEIKLENTGTDSFAKRKLQQPIETLKEDPPASDVKSVDESDIFEEADETTTTENTDNVSSTIPEENISSTETEEPEPLPLYDNLDDDSDDWVIPQTENEDEVFSDAIKNKDVNKDGYYDDILPKKKEAFPISRGELISKIIVFILLVIIIILYLIYVIR